MYKWKIEEKVEKIESKINEIKNYTMLIEEYGRVKRNEIGLKIDTEKICYNLDKIMDILDETITMINTSEETTRVEKAVIDKYVKELKEDYPGIEEATIRATCEQALREGIRDVSIIWEWLQDEV